MFVQFQKRPMRGKHTWKGPPKAFSKYFDRIHTMFLWILMALPPQMITASAKFCDSRKLF